MRTRVDDWMIVQFINPYHAIFIGPCGSCMEPACDIYNVAEGIILIMHAVAFEEILLLP